MKQQRVRAITVGLLTAGILFGVSGLAMGLLVPTETTVTELAPGVFFRKAQWEPKFIGCNQGWIVFDDFVLVIEASFPNQAEELIKEIRKTTDKPIKYVFDTHWHGDHADGNPVFITEGASAIAAESSREQFLNKGIASFDKQKTEKPDEYGKLRYGIPAVYFPKKMVIEDAHQRVELIHIGHGHTAGDAVATHDFFRDRRGFYNSVDFDQAAHSMDKLAALADIIVPGHDNYFLVD